MGFNSGFKGLTIDLAYWWWRQSRNTYC